MFLEKLYKPDYLKEIMKKTNYKIIGLILIVIGISLIAIYPLSITGAVLGFSDITSKLSFIVGLGLVVGGVGLILIKGKGLDISVKNEAEALLKQGKILTKSKDLIRLGERMDYSIKPGGSHLNVYNEDGFVTTIPKHREVNRNTARGIMKKYSKEYQS